MDKKGLVLVTYRDRLTHLNVFVPYMNRYFPHLRLAIIEQFDTNKWNKGLLYNAGYRGLAEDYDYVILHDIDFIPDSKVDYSYCDVPTLLSTECSQFNYRHCYPTFFGGVVGMNKEYYKMVNGFSNRFQGWGGEDDHLYKRFLGKGITPQRRMGNRFENFVHPHMDIRPGGKDWNDPDYQSNLSILREKNIDYNEGLSTAEYKIHSIEEHRECIHLKVRTV